MIGLKRIKRWLGLAPGIEQSPPLPARGPVDHVIIFDGTMSSLKAGFETNAGLAYKLLSEMSPSQHLSLRYEHGVQWHNWRHTWDVINGKGINRQIRRAYGYLASRYRTGDRIFLLGFSRGAFAARSLAGMIDRVGLLRQEQATVRNVRQAYRHYECTPDGNSARVFATKHCHKNVKIEMVGVWDTVMALGLRWPVLWRWTQPQHAFHSRHLGHNVRHGFHALAMDETRQAFAPVMWESRANWVGVMEQMWFRGCHSDIGGNLGGFDAARRLSNIPLVWMLEKMQGCNIRFPENWQTRFEQNAGAPMVGSWRGWAKLFLWRRRRTIGQDASERIHPTARGHKYATKGNPVRL